MEIEVCVCGEGGGGGVSLHLLKNKRDIQILHIFINIRVVS